MIIIGYGSPVNVRHHHSHDSVISPLFTWQAELRLYSQQPHNPFYDILFIYLINVTLFAIPSEDWSPTACHVYKNKKGR